MAVVTLKRLHVYMADLNVYISVTLGSKTKFKLTQMLVWLLAQRWECRT